MANATGPERGAGPQAPPGSARLMGGVQNRGPASIPQRGHSTLDSPRDPPPSTSGDSPSGGRRRPYRRAFPRRCARGHKDSRGVASGRPRPACPQPPGGGTDAARDRDRRGGAAVCSRSRAPDKVGGQYPHGSGLRARSDPQHVVLAERVAWLTGAGDVRGADDREASAGFADPIRDCVLLECTGVPCVLGPVLSVGRGPQGRVPSPPGLRRDVAASRRRSILPPCARCP